VKGLVVILVGGVVFGFGLAFSGLAKQEVVLSFLHLEDLGLAVTMAAALAITLPVYQLVPRKLPKPPLGAAFERFPMRVTGRHIAGGALFGVGWGVSGVCPGAAIASVGLGNWPILVALAGMLIGAYVQGSWASASASSSSSSPAAA
jgi:uncharacterized membrane protein YedE/YeeE